MSYLQNAASERPNVQATSEEFEFAALQHADNYRTRLVEEISQVCRGDLLEVGVGIGQIVEQLLKLPNVSSVSAVEPDPCFAERFHGRFPTVPLYACTTEHLPRDMAFDAIVCINVLEHIREDGAELSRMRALLQKRSGRLALLVPARAEIYAPIDKDFGHWRRYGRSDLESKLTGSGFTIERLRYYNLAGYFAWALIFKLLRRRRFDTSSVKAFDSLVFPWMNWLERRVSAPFIGQSLLAVARA